MTAHVENLIANPKRHFDDPREVLTEPTLSTGEKRRILENWRLDAQRLAEGAAENTSGGVETDLRDVSKAIEKLNEMEKPPSATLSVLLRTALRARGVGSAMAAGALSGAAASLLINIIAVPSLPAIALMAAAGLLVGGIAGARRMAKSMRRYEVTGLDQRTRVSEDEHNG
jgi:hypothetical protein